MNKLITWFTKSHYYHVGIFEGGSSVLEARPRGVVRRDLNGPDGDKHFLVIPAPDDNGKVALAWAQRQIGDLYDPIDVAAIVVETVFTSLRCGYTSPGRYSCGEFVTMAFLEAGVDLFPGQRHERIVPADYEKFLPLHRRSGDTRTPEESTTEYMQLSLQQAVVVIAAVAALLYTLSRRKSRR
ncbi:MAG TPA: hypothetical protein VF719_01675 [Abditibacteriaceae bacterium]